PLHGAEVAAMLSIPEVIVPPHPGITSAVGLLTTDLKYDAIRTSFQISTAIDEDRLNGDFEAMEAQLRDQFAADHIDDAQTRFERSADLRYVGQGYELRVEMPAGRIGADGLAEVYRHFHALHEAEYGHCFPDSPIEPVN